ncbi:ABC transporter, permease protein [Oceanicola granulosus HTCC2516]|uniref:ABC transporter, permease protein n=1 Tax=Oceanicola granulosus (strain ATCC BAA-861 / DSM 15982 / KCTC 12143 / HTCC2516) TaxID=314256 RepID=Q2CA71_OCEGH|nr:FtsX-like permease family protein [Oceanicola granulosus]EAR49574.1 ABC transporter, permease protein [Oceanicola granulosus HTCC2516]
MSWPVAARIARRELRGGLKGFRIFLACLALGVAAIAAVGTVRASIQAGLEREGAALLGGDAEVEFTYRFARDAERAWMEGIADAVSETVDFRSLAVVPRDEPERALTQVRGVDALYPLVGAVELDPPMPLADAFAGTGERPGAVMERILADRLALAPGDTFRLGEQTFVLSALLERYPDNSGGGFSLGPRTLVLTDDLAGSGLIQEGTLFETDYRLDLPDGADLAALEAEAEARFRDSGLRWRDAREGAPGLTRFVDRLGAFLVLVGLSGLAVGGVGVSSAVRAYLDGKVETIATLRTLGASRATIFRTYFLQIGALTLLGITLGLLLGALAPLLAAPLIEPRLPIPAEFGLYPGPLLEAALYGLLAALIFTLWPLGRIDEIRAATLFRDAFAAGRPLPAPRFLVVTALLVAALVGAAIAFSGTVWLTLWTAGGIAGALLLLALAALVARRTARAGARLSRGRPALRLALGAISARGGDATSVVLSLGLGLAVLAAVGQIDGNLRSAISDELPDVAPSYFFVDIQPDQIDGFRTRLDTDPAVSRVDSAPMLRGIITRINDIPAEEFAEGHWVVQGDRGLTYAAEMGDDTTLTAGTWWPADYDGPPLVSFSAEEAAEIGLALGDEITVNILGRDITAEVASFREVNFETAGIGFVMSMNPTALAGAPHSWIATVYAEPEAEAAILRDLASAYPNITAIRVRDAIDRVVELLSGIAAATRYGAAATLLTGFLVLIGAAVAGERARTYESAILKTLGAPRARILASFALRAALLGLAAGLVALAAGIAGGWAVMRFIMESDFSVMWPSALAIVAGGVLASLLAGLAFALRPLAAKPARVLRARE